MKIYYHRSTEGFSNTYIIVNPTVSEALIIDPGKITTKMIEHIEHDKCTFVAVLITHNHKSHAEGLSTLRKIYTPKIYAADSAVAGLETIVLKGEGLLKAIGFNIGYISVPGHTPDSMVYKIGNCLFTGDTLLAGRIGTSTSTHAQKLLITHIQTKILSQQEHMVIMPGHGPPSTIAAEKKFNMELGCPILHTLKDLPTSVPIN